MNEGRKFPGVFGWLGVLLLAASIFLTWWLTRPTAEGPVQVLITEDLEVACTGRVDTKERTISIEPEVTGRVLKVYVDDIAPNNKVQMGSKILEIDPRSYQFHLMEAQRSVDAAKVDVDLAQLQVELVPDQLKARREGLAVATARVSQAEKAAEGARQREEAVSKAGAVKGKIEQLEREAAEAVVKQLKVAEEVERQQIEMLEKSSPKQAELMLRAAMAKFQAATATLDEALRAVEECTLKAPSDGTILRMLAAKGGFIAPGSPMPFIVFAPAGPLVVRADLEQEFVYRVKPGMKVVLRDEARSNSPEWTGKVLYVSDYIARKQTILLDPGEMNDVRTAECVIEIEQSNETLRIGQRMRVRIQTR